MQLLLAVLAAALAAGHLLLAVPAPSTGAAAPGAPAGVAGGAAEGAGAAPEALLEAQADTIVWRLGAPRPGEGAVAGVPRLRLGLRALPPFRFQAAGPPPEPWAGLQMDPGARAALLVEGRARSVGAGADAAFFPGDPFHAADGGDGLETGERLRAFLGSNTELGLRVQGRALLGGDWSRYRPCLDAFQEACNPRVMPQLSPDLLFSVQLGGIIAERLRVDVDFDQIDPFEAVNTIRILYDGRAGEPLQRLEVGDVTLRVPASRYLTDAIPADNFGFLASGRLGPLALDALWAEQKGQSYTRVLRLSGSGVERGFVQADTARLDDADYARGQFFFLVDPAELLGYPHLDVLSLDGSEAPPHLAPGAEPIQLYRYENQLMLRQQVEGFIQADAEAERGEGRIVESGWFRFLQPGVDYYVHPSGLWVALRVPLRRDEMLAVTYRTATGEGVGDYNPEQVYNAGRRPRLRLLKASSANHQPGRPTWEMEMHQVYRVSGSPDVEQASVSVTISLGELSAGRTFKRTGTGADLTFLTLFGLDEEAPLDEVDPAFIWEPARNPFLDPSGFAGTFAMDPLPVQGTFLVFPTLRPFAEPPPLLSLGLSAEDTRVILGQDANARIYEDPDPFERDNGGRFQLTVPYQVRSQGIISSFSLALGIREGTERIYLGERRLTRLQDYEIDYELGQVTLRDPEALFATNPDAPVRAIWEQRQMFQTAPTSVMGLSARLGVGERGDTLAFLGLYQTERTLAVRPTLGLEPGALASVGLGGRLSGDASWLDRWVSRVPGLRPGGAARLTLDGEVVTTVPTPNTQGDVFLDDFDASADRPLSLLAPDWTRGSAPAALDGAETVLPPALDESTFRGVTWQHNWIVEGVSGDSVGIREGFLPRQEIDRQIRVAGSEVREPGMLVSLLGRDAADRIHRWASFTTTLAPTGLDLTKSEFLEFYVAGGMDLVLVIDLGEVSEDAFFVNLDGLTNGVKENGGFWGLGILDHEADPARGEIWGDEADRRGVWGEACLAERGRIYRAGDPRANCTRGNGRRDSEDLNGNGILDVREKHLRWVVRLDGSSPYLVRRRSETGTNFQLYRLPLQGLRDAEVGGLFTEADMRAVKNVRITVTGDRTQSLTLARMRIVGSRWIRRGQDGVLRGLWGDQASGLGRVEATPVSRVTEGDAYQSPPGVLERLADPTAAFGGQGVEFSEKSLAVRFQDILPGDRGEVYNRFPQRPRPFLAYREARMWVTARSGRWGDEPHWFFFKVGTDSENFYLYRTRLRPPSDPARVQAGDWVPEVVVDFDQWLELRYRAELLLDASARAPGDAPVTVWSADSTYAVVLGDRGRGPDLANVREMAFGVWNGGSAPISGEVWVDELRLSRGAGDAGLAGHLDLGLTSAGHLHSRLTDTSRGAHFRQLREQATYQTDRLVSFASTLWLDRFAPASWGLELPLTFSLDRASQDPVFLANSDVRGDRVPGLRPTGARQTRVSLGFSKRTPTDHPLLGPLLTGLSAHVGWFDSESGTIAARQEAHGVDARLGLSRTLPARDFPLVPPFLEGLLRTLLPAFLEEPVSGARLRWSPERVTLGASWLSHSSRAFRFDRIVRLPEDTLVSGTRAPREFLETSARVTLRPLSALSGDVTFLAVRDLLSPEDAASSPEARELIRQERRSLGGVDWGWETQRVVRTGAAFRPRLFGWLRNDLEWNSTFAGDRHPSYLARYAWGSDSTAVLLRNATGDRSLRGVVTLDAAALSRELLPSDTGGARGVVGSLGGLLGALRPLSVVWQDGLSSRFNRGPVDPGLGYQFGFGDADAFRFIGGDTASVMTDRTLLRTSGGVHLPLGLTAELVRSRTDARVLDGRSERSVRDHTWPDVRLRLDSVPVPGPARLVLRRIGLAAGYTQNEREVDLGGISQQRRTVSEYEIPVDVTLSWLGGAVTSYRASFRSGEGRDPTGGTQRERETHRLSLTSALRPPGGLARFGQPLVLTLILSQVAESECRATVARLACVPFLDQLSRSAGFTLSAMVEGFELGLQTSLIDRQSFVGQRPGVTQFQLGLFGQFLLEAGVLPGLPRR